MVIDDDSDEDFAPSPSPSAADGAKKRKQPPMKKTKAKHDDVSPSAGKKPKKEADAEYGIDLTEVNQDVDLTQKYGAMKNDELKEWLKVGTRLARLYLYSTTRSTRPSCTGPRCDDTRAPKG